MEIYAYKTSRLFIFPVSKVCERNMPTEARFHREPPQARGNEM